VNQAANRLNSAGFSYDGAGNLTADGVYTYSWDGESRVKTANGVTYAYDGDGKRVKKSTRPPAFYLTWVRGGKHFR